MKLKSKEFEELKKTWYKKAADSGFTDIEKSEDELHVYSTMLPYNSDEVRNYYRRLNRFLQTYTFSNLDEELIWYAHAQGHSRREIARAIKSSHVQVGRVIKKFINAMKRGEEHYDLD